MGASIFPERDKDHDFSILTPFNAVVPSEIFSEVMEREEKELKKHQMTFQIFAEWIRLRPKEMFLGYISAILTKIDLAGLYNKGELFCMPCKCGNVVLGNGDTEMCKSCSSSYGRAGKPLSLLLNAQILAEISDDTGGLAQGHNTLVADRAWEKLLGRTPQLFEAKLTTHGRTAIEAERLLKHWEQRLQYLRLTFMMGWSGKWGGGRMVVLDVLD